MLRQRLKFLLKDTAIYGIANGISKFIVFLTIPIIVKRIDVAEFGVWNMLTILGSVISAVLILGMDSAVVRYYYDASDLGHRRNVFSQGVYIQLLAAFIFCSVSVFFPYIFLSVVSVSKAYKASLLVIFLWIPANILTQYFQNWFKWTFQRARFLIISIGMAITNLILLYLYIDLGNLDLQAILWIQAVSAWLFALLGVWWCRKFFVGKIDSHLVRKFLSYGFPMMLIMVIGILSPAIDRIFLSHFLGEEELGFYSFIQKISVIMMVVVAAFQTAFGPFSFSLWDKPDAPETFSRFQSYYIMATGIVALAICSLSKPLVLLLGTSEYLGAEKYLPFLVMGSLIYGLYSFAAIGIFHSKRMGFNLLALSTGLVTTIAINAFFVPKFEEYAAAVAFMAGNTIMILAAYYFSAKFYKIEFTYAKDSAMIILLFLLLITTVLPFAETLMKDAILKSITLIPFFLVGCFLLLSKSEKKFIFRLIKR